MKAGRTLRELLEEINRQSEGKRDYLTRSRAMRVSTLRDGTMLEVPTPDGEPLAIRDTAHGQLAERVGIPKAYYDRMREHAPALFDDERESLAQASDDRRLVRTLDGHARAILSDRYRMLDNDDLAAVALPILMDHGFELVSAEITERKFYLKATTPRLQAEVKPGDVVQAGVVISNSEVGHGTLKIEPLLYFLVCTNGLVLPDASLRRQHVGRHLSDLDSAERYFRQETIRADDAAFWMKVRDVLLGMLDESAFPGYLNRVRDAARAAHRGGPVRGRRGDGQAVPPDRDGETLGALALPHGSQRPERAHPLRPDPGGDPGEPGRRGLRPGHRDGAARRADPRTRPGPVAEHRRGPRSLAAPSKAVISTPGPEPGFFLPRPPATFPSGIDPPISRYVGRVCGERPGIPDRLRDREIPAGPRSASLRGEGIPRYFVPGRCPAGFPTACAIRTSRPPPPGNPPLRGRSHIPAPGLRPSARGPFARGSGRPPGRAGVHIRSHTP